jgi:hypothetical protein
VETPFDACGAEAAPWLAECDPGGDGKEILMYYGYGLGGIILLIVLILLLTGRL